MKGAVIFWGLVGLIGLILWFVGGWLAVRWGAFVFMMLFLFILMMGTEGGKIVFDITEKGKRREALSTLLFMLLMLAGFGFLLGRFIFQLF